MGQQVDVQQTAWDADVQPFHSRSGMQALENLWLGDTICQLPVAKADSSVNKCTDC